MSGSDLESRFARIEEALAEADAASLSARKARLLAALLDDFCERAWQAWKADPGQVSGAEDVLGFRTRVGSDCPPMATAMALAEARPGGPRLEVRAVEVPLADYPGLEVQDFMVSLYNGHTVMRVVIAGGGDDAAAAEALPVLRAAVAWWRGRLQR